VTALEAEGIDFNRRLVGFSVREPGPAAPDIRPDEYYALLANAADYIVERYDAEVVFVPMEKTDVQHSHAVVAHMNNAERAEILRRKYSPRQILDLMGRFELAVGMRLHFLIFGALRGTPFAALPYASKVTGLLEDLGMDTPPLGSIGIGQLIARIDRSWDTRADIRATIGRRLPALRARAAQTNDLLLALLGESKSEPAVDASQPIQPH
jgi:polysaccharide pyruvyl transferase WcaK-like protein